MRPFYAMWLAIPGLLLAGMGAGGVIKKNVLGIFLLLIVTASVLLLPACSSSATSTNNNGITPNDTYTFTLTGADINGAGPSTTTPTTVTLVVN
jgi:predicted component of type VI protein secretion system